jgi:hypothetical protein
VRHLLTGCRDCMEVTRPVWNFADEPVVKPGRPPRSDHGRGHLSTMIKKATAGLLLILFLSLWAPSLGQSLPGYDTWGNDQTSEELYAASEARKKARQPFEKWRTSAYIVLASIGDEFIPVRVPPHSSRQIKPSSVEGRRGKKWSIEIWEGKERVLTCGWTGNKAIGIFVVPIQRRQVWECGEKTLDATFFQVAQADPLWNDVVDPGTAQ